MEQRIKSCSELIESETIMKKINICYSITYVVGRSYDADKLNEEDLKTLSSGDLPCWIEDEMETYIWDQGGRMSDDYTIDIDGEAIKDWE